jgi:hypothetical protein
LPAHEVLYRNFAPEFERIFETRIPEYNEQLCFIEFDTFDKPYAIDLKDEFLLSNQYDLFRSLKRRKILPFEKVSEELTPLFRTKGLLCPSAPDIDLPRQK